MKKVFSIIAVAFMAASFAACGHSAEDKAKMEQREQEMKDSTAAAISNNMEATSDTAHATEAAPAEAPAAEHH